MGKTARLLWPAVGEVKRMNSAHFSRGLAGCSVAGVSAVTPSLIHRGHANDLSHGR